MLRISNTQRQAFQAVALARYETDMAAHLAERSPNHAKVLGPDGMLEAVRFGIARAARRGYTLRGPVRLWLELMFLFGGYFDEDPLLPENAGEFVDCRDPDRQMPTAEQLHAVASDTLAQISGPDNIYNREALTRLQQLAEDDGPLRRETLEDELFSVFAEAHPQKIETLGEQPHRRLITEAIAQAEEMAVTAPRGIAVFPVLAFIVGSGFAQDPLYPWISRTLDDPTRPDPDQRAARLERRARTYLRHVIANLGIG